ncbi:MAG TPA: hypothetical protein PLI09_03835 [Candidatus Hydrogenedentes bacterium]|nr:hypothetical protein [Candidatus Hydrogenedentota bacterium]
MIFPALFTTGISAAAFWLLTPYFVVVNSVPWREPISWDELIRVAAVAQVTRIEADPSLIVPVIQAYAGQDPGSWREMGKGHAPRVLLAKLFAGRDIDAVNQYLRELRPWSEPGSDWELNRGDYDFTEVVLTQILYFFGEKPDRLYPDTLNHLLHELLLEEGGQPNPKVPQTLGLVFDTENHLLMRESSRYLKNQWLQKHGNTRKRYDNSRNGLQDWLTGRLNHIRMYGFHEFNSVPYERYALAPLLNLEAFAEPPEVASLARVILDDKAWRYALGSLEFRQCVPFCRQPRRADKTELTLNPMNSIAKAWVLDPEEAFRQSDGGFDALLMPYRPPLQTVEWMKAKPHEYFVQIGHGEYGSPEIFSGGPGYVLSAGGACPCWESQVVPRPTTLLIEDGAQDIKECFHVPGAGHWTAWNNTGVYRHFACGNMAVQVPDAYRPVAEASGWRIFLPGHPEGLLIAVYNAEGLGLMALFPTTEVAPETLLQRILEMNPDAAVLAKTFHCPMDGELTYDPNAPYGTWIMESANGHSLDRAYGQWRRGRPELSIAQ